MRRIAALCLIAAACAGPSAERVFLARFDGLRAAAESDRPVAVLTIVGYDKPNPLLIE